MCGKYFLNVMGSLNFVRACDGKLLHVWEVFLHVWEVFLHVLGRIIACVGSIFACDGK